MGLGYTSSCLSDEWSLFNNAAGLAKIENPIAAFTYDSRPGFSSFNRIASLFAVPVGIGVAGLGVYRFGDDLYNEQILSGAFSNSFGLASLGIKINYIQYHAEGFGNQHAATVSFGGIAELTPKISVGAHIANINQPKIGTLSRETIPTQLTLGLCFKSSDKLFIGTEVEKDLGYHIIWKSGIEYTVNKKFIARTGFNLHPQAGFAGLGFNPKNLRLNYAIQFNANLGFSHQATVSLKIKSKK